MKSFLVDVRRSAEALEGFLIERGGRSQKSGREKEKEGGERRMRWERAGDGRGAREGEERAARRRARGLSASRAAALPL